MLGGKASSRDCSKQPAALVWLCYENGGGKSSSRRVYATREREEDQGEFRNRMFNRVFKKEVGTGEEVKRWHGIKTVGESSAGPRYRYRGKRGID